MIQDIYLIHLFKRTDLLVEYSGVSLRFKLKHNRRTFHSKLNQILINWVSFSQIKFYDCSLSLQLGNKF